MADSRDRFRDYKTPVNCPAGNCGWVDLRHEFNYPDDKGQTEPAAGAQYRITLPNGRMEIGNLDDKGEAGFENTGQGKVTVEYEPFIDDEIKGLRQSIKTELDAIIEQEKADTDALQKQFNEAGWWGKRWVELKALARGVGGFFAAAWDALVGIGAAIIDAATFITHQAGEYVLDPLNAPETFKEDVAAIKAKYGALKDFVYEDLETYFTLMQDEATWNMLNDFAGEYFAVQHYSEYMEGGAEAATGLILTIVSAGAGAAAAAGAAGARIAGLAGKIAPLLKRLAKLIKRRKAKKKTKGKSNKRNTTVVSLKIKCFAPGKDARASFNKRYPKGMPPDGRDIDDEFARQLKNQQDGINRMSPDDLIEGIDSYDKAKRNPAQAKKIRSDFNTKIRGEKFDELFESGLSKKEAMGQAEKYADGITKQMDVLHNPDLKAGGKDQFDPKRIDKHVGDRSVNRSLGNQWRADKRVDGLKNQAIEAKKRGDKKMNVKLKKC